MNDAENNKKTSKKRVFGRPIPKGVSGNPGGRPKMDPTLKELKNNTSHETQRWICEVWNSTHSEIFEYEQDNSIPAGKKALASCLNNVIQVGSSKELSMFLDRIVGKPQEYVEISGQNGGPIETSQVDPKVNEILLLLKAREEDGR